MNIFCSISTLCGRFKGAVLFPLLLLVWIERTNADVAGGLSEFDSGRGVAVAAYAGDASDIQLAKAPPVNGPKAAAKPRDKVSDQLWARASRTVTEVLEQQHYLQQPLADAVSRRALDRYFEALDPERLYFSQSDLLRFRERFGSGFAKAMHDGKWEVIDEVLGVLGGRKVDCAVWLQELLSQKWEFVESWEVELSREHSDWPADETEAKRVWREQIGSELLAEVLDGVDLERARERVRSKYAPALQTPAASRGERIAPALAALARACDPHSDYLTQEEFEDAESELNLTRIGIGVTVDKDPSGLKVISIMAGGPAQRDGRLRVNDRIVAIASEATPFRELAGLSFSESVRLLRGKEGELVRLKVAPARAGDPAARVVVAIVREQMRSHEGEAYAKVLHATRAGETRRYGWVVAPAFYGNESGAPGGRTSSVARDVAGLVKRLKAETVAGIVLDLRGNLGGLLEEAVELGGLFCGSVAIAAVRIPKEPIEVMAPVKHKKQLYDGPLVVLVDHESASASEIVAGALQDHARAVVVGGEQTFGKGSVQASIPLSELMHLRSRPPLGGMLLTIGKFYRVNGQSTQMVGTRPDIVLPSTADLPSRGESALYGCLEHDAITPVRRQVAGMVSFSMLQKLSELSSSRVASSEAFALIREELQRLKQEEQNNQLSLQEAERRQNAIVDEKRYAALQSASALYASSRGAMKFQRLLIEDLRAKKLPLLDQDPLANSDPEGLAVEIEALEILADLVELWGHR